MDTITDGRLDIIIFPNGGKEYLAKLPSSPEIDEQMYLKEVSAFVAQNQGLQEPEKFTGTYRVKNDILEITWGPYAGEIPHYAEQEVPDMQMNMPDDMGPWGGFAFDEKGNPILPMQ